MKLYCLAVLNKNGFVDLRFRANADTPIKDVEPGTWYSIATRCDWDWNPEEKKTYCVTCDEAWLDKRADRVKYHIIHVRGNVSLEEHSAN